MKWPRYDPNRGYLLCEPCWNGRHWDPPFGCGCVHELPEKKSHKPDYSRQMVIDTGNDVIQIGVTNKHKDDN